MAAGTVGHRLGKAKTMTLKAFDNGMVGADVYRTFKKIKKTLKRGSDARNRKLSRMNLTP